MKTLIENLIKKTRHAELVSCAKHTVTNLSTYILNVLKTNNTPHPNPVLDLPVTSLAIYECASAFTLCSLVLHAHRVSPKLLRNRRLNLLAIRTRFTPSVRKSALPQGAREQKCAFTLAEVLITLGIIGIVAALTIPNIISKYNEIVYMAHLKKMVAILETTLSSIHNETGSIPDTFRECHNLMGGDNKEAYSCFEDMIIKYAPLNPNTRRVNKTLGGGGVKPTEYGHAFFYNRLYLPDGSVIALALITNGYVIFGFDVNGDKGPNKAGVDLYNVHYYPYQKTGKAYKTISSLNWIDINGCKNGDTQACFATLNHYNFNIPKDYPRKF